MWLLKQVLKKIKNSKKNFLSHNKTMLTHSMLIFTFGLMLSSCGEYLRGKPFRTNYIEIQTDGKLACLEDVSSDLQKFLDSSDVSASTETSEAETSGGDVNNSEMDQKMDQTVKCINDTLTELQTRVQGSVEATSYTSQDIYQILAKFASSAKISEVAAQNLVALKAALLGGDKTKITKDEINLLKKYLVRVAEEAKKLRPYIKLFYFKTTEKLYTKAFIAEAVNQLNLSLKSLYQDSLLSNSNYSFDDFKELTINVMNLTDDKKAMATIASKVNTLITGEQALLGENDRLAYIDNITELLRLFALYVNGYAKFAINNSADLNETISYIESIINFAENTMQYKKNKNLSAQTIDALVLAITDSQLLSFKITGQDAGLFYKTVLVRVFESGAKGNITDFIGIKDVHLRNLKREIGIYKVYSKMLARVAGEELFTDRGVVSVPLKEIQQSLGALNVADETDILNQYDDNMRIQIINNVNNLRSEFLESVPIIYRNSKIAAAINQNIWLQKWKDLAKGLYVKMLTRLLMQGWGSNYPLENIHTSYMTESDMINWYSEFKPFGIAIKMLDPRVESKGSAGFNVANLFTRFGNGDKKNNFREVAENLGILISSGGITYQQIRDDLAKANCNLPELDVFENHWNIESCLYRVLRANYKFYFASMTHLIAYLDTLDGAKFKEYLEAAVNVVRFDEIHIGSKVETSDITSMGGLLYFVENIFIAHDVNANWHISADEIRHAYPKFLNIATDFAYDNSSEQIKDFTSWKGTAAGYSCFSEQHLIQESFIFLIYNGRTPELGDFNILPCLRDKPLLSFEGEVDRRTLLNTLKTLKSAIGL